MGIFDKLKNTAQQAVVSAVQSAGNKREAFTFSALPESLAEMQALPEASLDTPFQAAALTVLALCAYAADKNIGTEIYNNHPMEYDDTLVRQIIECVVVESKEKIKVVYIGGTEIEMTL